MNRRLSTNTSSKVAECARTVPYRATVRATTKPFRKCDERAPAVVPANLKFPKMKRPIVGNQTNCFFL
jgi:hypothetical protein